jgi:hypothetical protein
MEELAALSTAQSTLGNRSLSNLSIAQHRFLIAIDIRRNSGNHA